LVMARHLAGYGAKVTVILLGYPEKIKTEESSWNWSILKKMPSVKLMSGDSFDFDFKPDVIVDGILGTGISGDIREPYASAINYINKSDCYKFAVDVPSGLDPQTGETANICVKSDMTVTFHKMRFHSGCVPKYLPPKNSFCVCRIDRYPLLLTTLITTLILSWRIVCRS